MAKEKDCKGHRDCECRNRWQIPLEQQVDAAKYFTISNLGCDEPNTVDEIHKAYEYAARIHEMENIDIRPEFNYWLRQIISNDVYCATEWKKFVEEGKRR